VIDDSGNRYVVDTDNNACRIRCCGRLSHFMGSMGRDQDFNCRGAAFDAGNGVLYVADYGGRRIKKFTPEGTFISSWSVSGPGYPLGVGVGNGGVYVVNDGTSTVQKYDAQGALQLQWGSPGTANGQFPSPMGWRWTGLGRST
jgi:DNA-binding beta-propeller fold protein YncE